MRILLVSSSSGSRGGGELYLLYLGRALAARGHKVTLWASLHPRMDELANSFSSFAEVVRSRYRNTYDRRGRSVASYYSFWSTCRIAAEWRKIGAEVVHINKQNLEDGLDLLNAARWSRLPSLCTIHLTQSALYLKAKFSPLRDWIARRALRRFRGLLVTVPESRRRDLLDFLGPTPNVRIVPTGVPLFDLTTREAQRTRTRLELGYMPEHLVFVCIGRMVPQKRPLLFLEEANRIHQAQPRARFLWVGDGTLSADWDTKVAERQMGECVQRLPWQMDVQPFLFAGDVLLHTADYEGLSLALLEALSAGLPCALMPNLLAEMPFLNENNSLRIDPEGRWLEALKSPVHLSRLGSAARRLAEREFSFTKMAENYETLYQVSLRSAA